MEYPSSTHNPSEMKRSNIRWTILGLCLLISLITYLDRVNISIAARHIIAENHLSTVQMGTVFSAFTFSYAIFQVPGGWLADRFGPRSVLAVAIVWWSAFTALTALASDIAAKVGVPALAALLLVRACLGVGEAAAWPCFNCIIANWVSEKDRAFASSIPLAGGGIGATIAPPLIAGIMLRYGWHWAFYVCALIGLVFGVAWIAWVRNSPSEHYSVNVPELRLITGGQGRAPKVEKGSIPLGMIFSAANTWLLFLSNFCCGYLIYIYLSWFYTYLTEARKMPLMQGSLYTTEPFIAIAVMSLAGGYLGDRAVTRFGITKGRRMVALPGMLLAGVSLMVGARLPDIGLSVFCLAIGAGAIYLALTAHWATSIDVAKEYAGTVSGFMNWGGNFGGVISPILTPWVARRWGWLPAFEIAAAIVLSGAFLWLVIEPAKFVVRKERGPLVAAL